MIDKQRGQALPLGLALALVGVLAALVLYNIGRTATDKARLANTADAAAYSGLLWQARALNFQAYTNRAMIANQVSIAQAVSLRSWTSYGAQTSRNLATVLAPVPYINAFAKGVQSVMDTVEAIVGPVSEGMVTVIDLVNRGVAVSQQAMFASSFAATPEIVREVVRRSDARFESDTLYSVAGLQDNLSDWNAFTRTYERDEGPPAGEPGGRSPMDERTALVNESLDPFSRARDWDLFESFWLYSTPISRHKIFRRGKTALIRTDGPDGPHWEWKAKDTMSLHNRFWRPFRSDKKQELEIGWGEAFANDSGSASLLDAGCRLSDRDVQGLCGYWTVNERAERWGEAEREQMGGYSGLNAFRSLSEASLDHANGDPVLRLRTEVALDTAKAHSSDSLGASGTFASGGVTAPGNRLSSISIAEVYYRRPDEARGEALSAESANGYNAFWDVRLAPIPTEERLLAVGLREFASSAAPANGDSGERVAAIGTGGVPLPSVGGTLPDYVGTLASAYAADEGLDVEGLRDAASSARALGDLDISGFTLVDDPVGEIEGALTAELKGALSRILENAVGELERTALTRAEGAFDHESITAAVAEGKEFADDMKEMFEQVETLIAPEIANVVGDQAARNVELIRLIGDAEAARSRVDADRTELGNTIARLRAERAELEDVYRDKLAERFLEIVRELDPTFDIPFVMAQEIASELLAGYEPDGSGEGAIADVLPWLSSEDEPLADVQEQPVIVGGDAGTVDGEPFPETTPLQGGQEGPGVFVYGQSWVGDTDEEADDEDDE